MFLAAADFRGLGRSDLAVVQSGSSAISLLTNDGAGAFAVSSFSASLNNMGIATGDFTRPGSDEFHEQHRHDLPQHHPVAESTADHYKP